jgi:hypothetical protein
VDQYFGHIPAAYSLADSAEWNRAKRASAGGRDASKGTDAALQARLDPSLDRAAKCETKPSCTRRRDR